MKYLWLAAFLIFVAGAVALYGLFNAGDESQPGGGAWSPPPPTVETETVEQAPAIRTVDAIGDIRANESVVLQPEVAGRISKIHFDEGEPVDAGELLVSLDSSTYEAEVRQRRAELEIARLNYQRADELVKKQASPVDTRDEARAKLDAATALLDLAEARLAKTRIKAPFSGIVGLRHVSPGDFVSVGADLVSLVELDPIKIDFKIGEIHLTDVSVGQTLKVTVGALPGRVFNGEVLAIEPVIDISGRAIRIRGRLPNPDLVLRPGLFAEVHLVIGRDEQALWASEEAVVPQGNRHFVYRVENGSVQLTEVELGIREGARVQITRGLERGDEIVTAGQIKLRDGQQVQVLDKRWQGETTVSGEA